MKKAGEILESLNRLTEEKNFEVGDNIAFKANTTFKIGKIIEITKDNLGFTSLKCQHTGDMGTSFNCFLEVGEGDVIFFAPPEAVITLDELKQKAEKELSRIQDTIQKFDNFCNG